MEEQQLPSQLTQVQNSDFSPVLKRHNHILLFVLGVALFLIFISVSITYIRHAKNSLFSGFPQKIKSLSANKNGTIIQTNTAATAFFQEWQFTDSNINFSLKTPKGYINTIDYLNSLPNSTIPKLSGLLLQSKADSSHVPILPVASIAIFSTKDSINGATENIYGPVCTTDQNCYKELFDFYQTQSKAMKYNIMNIIPVETTIFGKQIKGIETDIFDHSNADANTSYLWNSYIFLVIVNNQEFNITLQVYGSLAITNAQKPLIDTILSTFTVNAITPDPIATPTSVQPSVALESN